MQLGIEIDVPNNIDLTNFEESFEHFFKTKSKKSSFLHWIVTAQFSQQISDLLLDASDKIYKTIKPKIQHRPSEKSSFADYLAREDCAEVLSEIRRALATYNGVHKHFLDELDEVQELIKYFESFKQQFVSKTSARQLIFEEYYQRAQRLHELLSNTHYEPILKLLKKHTFDPIANPAHKKQVIFPESGRIVGPDEYFIYANPNLADRIYRYVTKNITKLIVAGLFAAGLAVACFFIWPLALTAMGIFIIASSSFLAGVFGSVLMGVSDYILSKKTKRVVNAKVKRNIEHVDEGEKEVIKETTEQRTSGSNVSVLLSEKEDKESLTNLILLLNQSLTPIVLQNLDKEALIRLLDSLFKTGLLDNANLFELAKKYLITDQRLFDKIDFEKVKHNLKNYFPQSKNNYILKIDQVAQEVDSIKYQLLLGLEQKGELKFNDMIRQQTTAEYEANKNSVKSWSPSRIAVSYFVNLPVKNKRQANLLLSDLFKNISAANKELLTKELSRIRKVLSFFLIKLDTKASYLDEMSDELLAEHFFNAIQSQGSQKLASITYELITTTNSTDFNHTFLPRFLKASKQREAMVSVVEEAAKYDRLQTQTFYKLIKLFINSVAPWSELPFKRDPQQTLQYFHILLAKLSLDEVVKTYSNLRYNAYITINADDLLQFYRIVEGFYEQVNDGRSSQLKNKMKFTQTLPYIDQNIQPQLDLIKRFLGYLELADVQVETSFESLMKIFFQQLDELPIEKVKDFFAQNNLMPTHFNFLSKLIYNFFETRRPHELIALKQTLLASKTPENIEEIQHSPKVLS